MTAKSIYNRNVGNFTHGRHGADEIQVRPVTGVTGQNTEEDGMGEVILESAFKAGVYQQIIQMLREPMVIVDSQYRFLEANERAKDIFPQLKDLNPGDLLSDDMLLYTFKHKQDGEIISDNFILHTDVQRIEYEGQMFYAMLLFDMTEERMQLDQMQRLKVEADMANYAKTDFLARMSHEIRTPINAVLGMAEMILRESSENSVKEYALDIRNSATLLLSIINEILDSTKIETGKLEIIPGNYEIGKFLNELYNMIIVKAQEKGLQLIFDIQKEIPSEYFGDGMRLRQVLVNLLTNAVKYTQKGSVRFTLRVKTDGDNAVLHYAVEDTGIGIKEEDIGKLYSEYQRIDEARNRYIEGTGLGMSITIRLLRLMGSSLKVESEYEKGSVFSFDIDQKIINTEPLNNFKGKIEKEADEYQYVTGYIAPDAKVLVVDDNEMNRKVFCGLLKQTKMQITQADSGAACLQRLREGRFDLIFLDHMMPEMDGIETFHHMRKEQLCEGTPVIMLSANAVTGARENYMKEGFDDFMTKPVMQAKLDEMIQTYLPESLVIAGNYAPAKSNMDEIGLPELDEFDFDYALEILKTEELLMDTLMDFYNSLDDLKEKLNEFVQELEISDYLDQYRIEVHALKSTAATVGALLLSKLARILEVAAKDENIPKIRLLHPVLIEEIDKHKERLSVIAPKEEEKISIDSMDQILPYFEMLSQALDRGDYNSCDFIAKEINKYSYGDLQDSVDTLLGQIRDMESDEALETIAKIQSMV